MIRRLAAPLEGLVDPYSPGPAPVSDVWAYLRSGLAPLRRVLLLSLVFTMIAAVIEVWLIAYAGRLIDTLSTIDPAELWEVLGWELLGVAFLLLILRPLSHFAREGINDLGLRPNTATLFRWRAIQHVSRQSVGWFQEDFAGRTATRTLEIGSTASNAIFNLANAVAYVGVYLVGIAIFLASVDLRLTLPVLIWLGLYAMAAVYLLPRFLTANERFQNARSALAGYLVDTFTNMDTMQIFAGNRSTGEDAKARVEDVRQKIFALQRVEVAINITVTLLEGIIMAALVGYAIYLWSGGIATLGVVASALALVFKITSMVEWFMEAVSDVVASIGTLREELSTVAQPITIPDAPDAVPLRVTEGAIRIRGLSHHYGKGGGGLDGIDLDVAPGEKVAIVGRSGAGKSTLVNLILRFHEAETGRIEVDGQDIRNVTQASLRGAIGMVSQQASLLHRSVRENIALADPDAPDAAIRDAADRANAAFVDHLRDREGRAGFDAHVGERGVKLSGGERQRIALARVILKDAPILILDEATSALDSEAEAAIQSALTDVMEGKTVIAIAHRLSTIARMDRIIVLDGGRIVEEGDHRTLLERGGLYAGFWQRQSGGFIGMGDAAPDERERRFG